MNKRIDAVTRAVDRIISGSLAKQIIFFLFLAIIVFGLLFTVRLLLMPEQPESSTNWFWDTVFNYIDVGGFENLSGAERWIILLTNLCGMIIFAGVLVALLTNTIYQRIESVNNGEVYYSFSDHIVVIGYDHICDELARQLAEQYEFVLQTSRDASEVRSDLFCSLSNKVKNKIIVVSGNRVLRKDIEKLNIDKCKEVFLLGDMEEEAHDSKNIECLKNINKIAVENGKKIRCHVLFEHHSTFAAFQQQELSEIRGNIDLVPFNFCDMWAQKVFVKKEYKYDDGRIEYQPLDHEPIKADSPMRVHLVILGMSKMGISLALQAAHICHFPNFMKKNIKTRITFIDEEADAEMNTLKHRLRNFFDEIDYSYQCFEEDEEKIFNSDKKIFTDIEFQFIKGHSEDDEVQDYLVKAADDKTSYLTIAVAVPDSSDALSAALYLPARVYDSNASVLVWQKHSHAIVSMLSHRSEGEAYCKYKNLRPFGMIDNCYEFTEADDLLPMMIKYVYDKSSFNEELTIREFNKETIRNYWNDWKPDQNISALKASNRYAANFISVKERSLDIKQGVDLDRDQIYYSARMEHNRWVAEKLLVGFRAPSPEEESCSLSGSANENRNVLKARFIHPDIKAYDALGHDDKNIDVRVYDKNISTALPYMLKAIKE